MYVKLLGYQIDSSAWIGRSIVNVVNLQMGPGSRIGHMSIIRNLESLELSDGARIGTFNWIFGYVGKSLDFFKEEIYRKSTLIVGEQSAITARHIIDCIDGVNIGKFSIVAGHRSQLLTHSIDLKQARQSCAPITIGDYCFIGTGCILLKGANVPSCSIVSAGSVFSATTVSQKYSLFSGNPAVIVKQIPENYAFFCRLEGFIH